MRERRPSDAAARPASGVSQDGVLALTAVGSGAIDVDDQGHHGV